MCSMFSYFFISLCVSPPPGKWVEWHAEFSLWSACAKALHASQPECGRYRSHIPPVSQARLLRVALERAKRRTGRLLQECVALGGRKEAAERKRGTSAVEDESSVRPTKDDRSGRQREEWWENEKRKLTRTQRAGDKDGIKKKNCERK